MFSGKFVHGSCVFGVEDLPTLIKQPHMVAHKVYLTFQHATFNCLMEWIQNRTYSLIENDDVNYEFYKMLPAVLYRESQDIGSEFNCSSGVRCVTDLG